MKRNSKKRLLVFNCHEAWVYQLSALDYALDIVDGLSGRYTKTWDTRIRPMPTSARPIALAKAQVGSAPYDCIITHNITDLLDIRHRREPRILVLHLPIEARQVEEHALVSQTRMQRLLHVYTDLVGAHVVAVSAFKGRSWGFDEDVVPFGFDTEDYAPCSGERACGLRVCNFALRRKRFLLWDFHQEVFQGLPVRIVGHNPEMPAVEPSQSWDHMKRLFRSHRFFIHTAHPELEDGYNMATIEAMAAGLPVLGNCHPSSPIRHGVSGFLSDDPRELRSYAKRLLSNRQLALDMGAQARKTVKEGFSLQTFRKSFEASIKTAQQKNQAVSETLLEACCCGTPARAQTHMHDRSGIVEFPLQTSKAYEKVTTL